jgi:hypothetical protein
MDKHMNRGRARLLVLFGLLALVAGIYTTVIVYAVGAMPHQQLSGRALWGAMLADVIMCPAVVPAMIGVGLATIGLAAVAVFLPVSFGWTDRPPSGRARATLLYAAVLFGGGLLVVLLTS